MLTEWQQLQTEVWEINVQARDLEPAAAEAVKKLTRQRQYHAELRHAFRQLRDRSGGNASGSRSLAGSARNLEDELGSELAKVWTTFMRALLACPRAVPAIAHAAGYQTHELFANLVAAFTDDALVLAMRGGEGLARALQEVLAFEFDMLVPQDCAPQVPALLADGSFLATLLKVLTAHAPACMAWAQSVLGEAVLEAISQAIPAASSTSAGSSASGSSRGAASQKQGQQPATDDACSPASAESPTSRSVHAFIGVDASQLGDLPRAGQMSPERAAGAALCKAAAAIVASLCDHAGSAPAGLCRLSYAVCSELGRRCPDPAAAEAVRHALLGGLILSKWLVPSLLSPGQLSHAGCSGSALHAEPAAHMALMKLAKLLKAIASGTPLNPADAQEELSEATPEFVSREARRLRTGLFDVLLSRGEASPAVPTASTTERPGRCEVAWPRCFVCTTSDLATIADAVAKQPAVVVAAVQRGVAEDIVRAVASSAPGPADAAVAPVPVAVWLQSASAPSSCKAATAELLAEGDCSSTGGTDVGGADETSHKNGFSFEDCVSIQGDAGGTVSVISETPIAVSLTGYAPDTGAPAAVVTGSRVVGDIIHAMELLWQVLSEPHLLEGHEEATLLSALRPFDRREFGWSMTEQLRMEMLVEWLSKKDLSRAHLAPKSGRAENIEGRLLTGVRKIVEARKLAVANLQRSCTQLRVALRLVEQHCSQFSAALRHCGRLAVEQRCASFLQSLWTSASSRRGRLQADAADDGTTSGAGVSDANLATSPLEFCVLSPPSRSSQGPRAPPKPRKTGWGGLFGSSGAADSAGVVELYGRRSESSTSVGSTSAAASTAAQGAPQIFGQNKVQLYEVAACPYHRFSAVSATMGLEQLDPEQKVKHRTPRSLRQAIHTFQQLPLENVVQGEDSLCIAAAIHAFLEMLVARLVTYCRLQDPAQFSSVERSTSSSAWSSTAGRVASSDGDEKAPEAIVRVDERHIGEYVAHFVFGHLHARLFPSEPTRKDLQIAERISGLAWLRPSHLDVPARLMQLSQVQHAIALLRRLGRLRSPGDMLAALASAFRKVSEAAAITAQLQLSASSSSNAGAVGADELVPLFILVVLRANPPMFNSVLLYTENLTTRAQMMTEQGYALTLLRAAVSFTESVKPSDLVGLAPGEWERHMQR